MLAAATACIPTYNYMSGSKQHEDQHASGQVAQRLTSPLLSEAGFKHAFFTRGGGVSEGPYASLNFSYAVGDRAEAVDENLRRAAAALGVLPNHVYFLAQVHADGVVELREPEPQREVLFREGDALLSSNPQLACGVRTADCVPILVADQSTGRVAAVHAGWRGMVARVLPAALRALAGPPNQLLAAIGPHISVDRFEVSEEVAAELAAEGGEACVRRQPGRKPHVSLRQIARKQLQEFGVPGVQIDDVLGCTHADAEQFFSFRRDGKHSGRHLSAIVARAS